MNLYLLFSGQRNKAEWETHPKIHIDSVTIKDCSRGISSHHFNRDISDYGDHFHRYSNETILITSTDISQSKSEAIFVWAPFWDPFIKNLAEVIIQRNEEFAYKKLII